LIIGILPDVVHVLYFLERELYTNLRLLIQDEENLK